MEHQASAALNCPFKASKSSPSWAHGCVHRLINSPKDTLSLLSFAACALQHQSTPRMGKASDCTSTGRSSPMSSKTFTRARRSSDAPFLDISSARLSRHTRRASICQHQHSSVKKHHHDEEVPRKILHAGCVHTDTQIARRGVSTRHHAAQGSSRGEKRGSNHGLVRHPGQITCFTSASCSGLRPSSPSLVPSRIVCTFAKKKSDLHRIPTQRTCNLLRLDVGASRQLRIEAQKGNDSQATHRHVSEGKQSGLLVRIFAAPSRERRAQDNAGRRCNRSKGGTAACGRWHAGWGRDAS